MQTIAEQALQRAQDYVRDRGWRHEPLTWEEVGALIDELTMQEGAYQDGVERGRDDLIVEQAQARAAAKAKRAARKAGAGG